MEEKQFQIVVSHEGRVIECLFLGAVTREVWFSAFEEMINHDGGKSFKQARYQISDYTNGSLAKMSSDDVKKTAVNLAVQAYELNPDLIVINVVPGDLEFGLSRMFEGNASQVDWEIHTVRTRTEMEDLID